MTTPPPPHWFHHFGRLTSQVFSRLYRGVQQQESSAQLVANAHQQQLERRNRKLRRMLKDRTMEVERLLAILDQISEGIILQELNGSVVLMNQAAKELLGSERNLWQSDIVALFSQYQDVQEVGAELVPLGSPHRLTVNQRVLEVQVAAMADRNGARFGTLILLKDITRDTLDERLKNSFVNHISHELKTPLAPMRVASEILLATPADKAPNRRMLELISRNIDILDRMVGEMIDIATMRSGAYSVHREPLTLDALLWDLVQAFEEDVREAQLTLNVWVRDSDRMHFTGDAKALKWALSNLLRNSIQYNEPQHSITLRARLDEGSSPAHLVVEVADTGVGISAEDMPHVFELFYRGTPRTRSGKRLDPRGLGHGLYIARAIAQAHGGYLVAHSQVGEGTVMTLAIPIT